METHVKQLKVNGLPFQYRESGEQYAPPLIALHALGASGETWDKVATVLGEKYHVLALDQRGHGGSVRTNDYSFELMCKDVLDFADAMNLKTFTLMGHSMGGTVSYLFAEAYPSRLERLIVVDSPPPFEGEQLEVPAKPNEPLSFDWQVLPSIFQQLNNPKPEWWLRLPDINVPTLLIGGENSHIPQNKLQTVSKLIPNCEFVTIDQAGHFVHVDNVRSFLTAVENFLHT